MIVVCGIDGSVNAQHALQWAADLVASTGGEVIAIHALGLVERLGGETVPTASHRGEIEDLCSTVWCARLADSGVAWRHAVLDGHPVDVMLRAAEEYDAGLIVVGRRGQGNAAAIGSTSAELARHATFPVAIVPSPGS
jgi:nucleotide-binding universal stress UspA family protein